MRTISACALDRAAQYWRTASKLRGMADLAPLPGIAERLLDLAAQYERLAETLHDRREPASPPGGRGLVGDGISRKPVSSPRRPRNRRA